MTAVLAMDEMVVVQSHLLGALEIRTDTLVTFAAGVPGFPQLKQFALIDTQRDEFVWLQSIDDTGVTFLLGDPFTLVPGFELEVPAADLAAIGAPPSPDALLVLVVVELAGGVPVSANLQGPIVIDRQRRAARQVVLPDSPYGMQFRLRQ